MTKNHSHSQCDSDSIILTKRAAELSTDNLPEVFNKECRDSQEVSFLTFKKLESTLVKRRRLQLPKLPSTLEDLDELLMNSKFLSSLNNIMTDYDLEQRRRKWIVNYKTPQTKESFKEST